MQWTKTRVLVTGGASFIGSHLVDALIERGAQIRVEFIQSDLLNPGVADQAAQDISL